MKQLSEFERGLVAGVVVAHGSFGGDGKQPQVVIKMHVRSERLLRFLEQSVPGSRLYGPYHHGNRHFFQWTVRGRALADALAPLLEEAGIEDLDGHAGARYAAMKENYRGFFTPRRP